MKRVSGSPVVPRKPNSGAPVAIPVDSAAFDELSGTLDAILEQMKLTNMLLMEIGK